VGKHTGPGGVGAHMTVRAEWNGTVNAGAAWYYPQPKELGSPDPGVDGRSPDPVVIAG